MRHSIDSSIVVIDNYDSFTYNIIYYLRCFGHNPLVFKNDEININELYNIDFTHIIISPGPSNPNNAGISLDVIDTFYTTKNILGVCLGHQCIAYYFDADVKKSDNPMHGKVSYITFDETSKLYKNIDQGFRVTRYHSLIVDNIKFPLKINARSEDNVIMGIEHFKYNIFGVQFHPESILSEFGKQLLFNFINIH